MKQIEVISKDEEHYLSPFADNWNRRRFVQTAGSIAALSVAEMPMKLAATTPGGVSIIVDPSDPVAGAAPALWAAKELERSLTEQHIKVSRHESVAQAPAGDLCVMAAGADASASRGILKRSGVTVAAAPEALGLVSGQIGGRKVVLACGSDARGLVYALLELADRVNCASKPMAAFELSKPFLEQPANRVRSINRCFQSDIEDKPWFNDRDMSLPPKNVSHRELL